MLTLIREYKSKNVMLKAGYRRKISLNYSTFAEMVPWSCLIDELQFVFFGVYNPPKVGGNQGQFANNKTQMASQLEKSLLSQFKINYNQKVAPKRKNDSRLEVQKPMNGQDMETFIQFRKNNSLDAPCCPEVPPPEYSPFEIIPNLDEQRKQ